jgi:protein gp37
MSKSSIEWTQMTWNPTTGCDKVSAGCKFCYAEVLSKRLNAMGQDKYANGFKLTLHPTALSIPSKRKKPTVYFVNSMSDLFHKDVPLDFIQKVFKVMTDNPQHIFQVLTKRSERLLELSEKLTWTPNIWVGVSVEDDRVMHRINNLKCTGAKVKFLSCEPLLRSLKDLNLEGIDWVIVGGESGPKARPMEKNWVIEIRDLCATANVPFFFKQWGGTRKKKTGRELDGKIYDEMPQYPARDAKRRSRRTKKKQVKKIMAPNNL